jgi:hypothetical protein
LLTLGVARSPTAKKQSVSTLKPTCADVVAQRLLAVEAFRRSHSAKLKISPQVEALKPSWHYTFAVPRNPMYTLAPKMSLKLRGGVNKSRFRRAMKKTCISHFLVLVSILGVGTAQAGSASSATAAKKLVAAREQLWLQSHKTNNPDLVAPLLGKSIVVTLSDGRVHNKAETLAIAKKTKYDSIDYIDVKITVFGNTAIATGGFDAKGTDEAGKPFEAHERWTDTWLRISSGKWLCIASSDVPVKK